MPDSRPGCCLEGGIGVVWGLQWNTRKPCRVHRCAHHMCVCLCMLKHPIVHLKHMQLVICWLYFREGDTSELHRLGELLTLTSVIFLVTEGTMNYAEDSGKGCGRPRAWGGCSSLASLDPRQGEELYPSSGGPSGVVILSSKGFCARAADQGLARLGNPGLGIKMSSREQSTWWRAVLAAEELRPPSNLT